MASKNWRPVDDMMPNSQYEGHYHDESSGEEVILASGVVVDVVMGQCCSRESTARCYIPLELF